MHSTKVLLAIAALAGTSLSQKSDTEFCDSFLTSFYSVMATETPATPTAILDFIASNTQIPTFATTQRPGATLDGKGHQLQLCALATALPSSLLPAFHTLAGEFLSFGRRHSDDILGYVTDCAPDDEVAESTKYFEYIFTGTGDLCHDAPIPTPGTAAHGTHSTPAPTPAPTYTSALNSSALTSSIPTAAAARPTGAWLGAAAVGGLLGAAALL
jgi:hypothetical protein